MSHEAGAAKAAVPASTQASRGATAMQAPPAAPTTTSSPLNLKSLEQRLKESGAIGLMTKLALKNQVDDLVGRFRQFHAGHRPPTLDQLRPDFELLLMKVLSLLQDKDAALAKDINASRAAIWSVLADPAKFSNMG
jgi:hypothetical protein